MNPLWANTHAGRCLREFRGLDGAEIVAVCRTQPIIPPRTQKLLDRWDALTDQNRRAAYRRHYSIGDYHPFSYWLLEEVELCKSVGVFGRGHAWGDKWWQAASDWERFEGSKLLQFQTRLAEWINAGCPMEDVA